MNQPQPSAAHPKKKRSGSGKRQRDCIIKFRVKAQERAEIKDSAVAAGLTVGSFLRSLALAAPRTRAVPHDPVRHASPDTACIKTFLGRVGHYEGNLYQVVRRMNIGYLPEAHTLAELADDAREFLEAARAAWDGA